MAGKVKTVLKTASGVYVGHTRESRRKFPDAVPMRIQMPTFDEKKNGIGVVELPLEDEENVGRQAKENNAERTEYDSGDLSGAELIQKYEAGEQLAEPAKPKRRRKRAIDIVDEPSPDQIPA